VCTDTEWISEFTMCYNTESALLVQSEEGTVVVNFYIIW
jgi:hypothetical protein